MIGLNQGVVLRPRRHLLVGEEKGQNEMGLEQGTLRLEDKPPERMHSNLICTSKEHQELDHDLRGKKSTSWETITSDPRQGSSQRHLQNSIISTRNITLSRVQTWRRGLEIAHSTRSRFRAGCSSMRVYSTRPGTRQNHKDWYKIQITKFAKSKEYKNRIHGKQTSISRIFNLMTN